MNNMKFRFEMNGIHELSEETKKKIASSQMMIF